MENERDEKKFTIFQTCVAEFIGTMMLMLIGCSANAALTLNPQVKPNQSKDVFAISLGWGFGAFVGIACSMMISGAHINPAVTIALASLGRFPWKRVIPYMLAQYLGSFVGSALVYLCYFDAIETQNSFVNHTQRAYGSDFSTGGIFATYPMPHMTIFSALIDQIIGTASLLFGVMAVGDQKLNIPKALQPFILSFIVLVNCMVFGYNEGAPLNPARDLGPRVFTAMAGWGIQVFKPLSGHYWYVGGIIGPHIGGVCGVWLYYLFIEYHYKKSIFTKKTNYQTNGSMSSF